MIGGDANPGIGDFEAHQAFLAVIFQHPSPQRDMTPLSKFDGIAEIIDQGLTNSGGVPPQPQRNSLAFDVENQTLFACSLTDHGLDLSKECKEFKIGELQLQTAFFNLRQIENVVDDCQQMFARRVDFVQSVSLF